MDLHFRKKQKVLLFWQMHFTYFDSHLCYLYWTYVLDLVCSLMSDHDLLMKSFSILSTCNFPCWFHNTKVIFPPNLPVRFRKRATDQAFGNLSYFLLVCLWVREIGSFFRLYFIDERIAFYYCSLTYFSYFTNLNLLCTSFYQILYVFTLKFYLNRFRI